MTTLEIIVLVLIAVCWIWQFIVLAGAMAILASSRAVRFGILPGIRALIGTAYLAVVLA